MVGQATPNCPHYESNSQYRRTPFTLISTFSDGLFLKIFYHCRPVVSSEHELDDNRNLEGEKWADERWWYKLAHICKRWRYLLLTSAPHLDLCLFCTYGTPIADMLAYPPTFSLILDYGDEDRELTAQDEEGISLALRRRRRVRRIRLWLPAQSLRRLLAIMDGEFRILENLYIKPLTDDKSLTLPASFNAPHLRHFFLRNIFQPLWMFPPRLPIPHNPSTERFSQSALCHSLHSPRSQKTFVHILDDDSLLNVFWFYRPIMVFGNSWKSGDIHYLNARGELWWHRLAHVCRRWRCLTLASASHLNLCLVCMPGTPVADMLTNSPPLPLIIGYIQFDSITVEDEEGVMLALQHRDRVRRISLQMPLLDVQKLVPAIDEEFPMLEYLNIMPFAPRDSWLTLPNTFQAPHLRHLEMARFTVPIRSPLITTNTSLVTFNLTFIHQSAYRHPNDLLQQISLMPQLESLWITFDSPVPNRDVERQLMHKPVATHVTLPNLRQLGLKAASTYMEALLARMITPLLEVFTANFFFQPNYSVPHLLEFVSAAQNLRVGFGSAKCNFWDGSISVFVFPHNDTQKYSFSTNIICRHLDWQVSFATQIFLALRTVFTAVEHLTLDFWLDPKSSEMYTDIDPSQWRELLRLFDDVKILRVNGLIPKRVPHSFQIDDGGPPLELLPELTELQYPIDYDLNAFSTFIDARQKSGRPVTLVPHGY